MPSDFKLSALKRHALLDAYRDHEGLQQLLFFTQGYYLVESLDSGFMIYDARYGLFGDWDPDYEGRYVFQFHFDSVANRFSQSRPSFEGMGDLFRALWVRAL